MDFAEDVEIGMVGARAALDTLTAMLTEFAAKADDPDLPVMSLNDVRRLIVAARESIGDA